VRHLGRRLWNQRPIQGYAQLPQLGSLDREHHRDVFALEKTRSRDRGEGQLYQVSRRIQDPVRRSRSFYEGAVPSTEGLQHGTRGAYRRIQETQRHQREDHRRLQER